MADGLAERPHRQIAGANDARPREARPGARQRRRVADHARMIIGESLLVPVTSLPSQQTASLSLRCCAKCVSFCH